MTRVYFKKWHPIISKKTQYKTQKQSFSNDHKDGSRVTDARQLGEQKAVVITQDLRIQTTRHQNELYKKYGLGVVFFKPPSDGYSFWKMVEQLVKRWPEIKNKTKLNRPFAFRCRRRGNLEKLN